MAETAPKKRGRAKAEPPMSKGEEAVRKGQMRHFKMVPEESTATVTGDDAPSEAPAADPAQEEPAAAREAKRQATRASAGALHAALKDVLGAVQARSEIPVLSHVLIEASGAQLRVTGTDLDLWVARDLAAENEPDWQDLTLCLPAKPLEKLLGQIEGDCAVTIERSDAPQGGVRVTLRAGRSRIHLNGMPAEDFPRVPPFAGRAAMELPCGMLDDALSAVGHAISSEEARYYLNGVLVHVAEGQLRFAATDGSRLARWSADLPAGGESWPAQIWPRRMVTLLAKLLPAAAKTGSVDAPAEVLVECADEASGALLRLFMAAADGGEVVLVAKSIDGTFPAYERVIPTDTPVEARIGKGALAAGVRRAAVLASEKSRAVKLALTADKVTVRADAPGLGDASIELPAMFEPAASEAETSVGFNADYLLAALAKIATDELVLKLSDDSTGPALILPARSDDEAPRLLQVLMPMRV